MKRYLNWQISERKSVYSFKLKSAQKAVIITACLKGSWSRAASKVVIIVISVINNPKWSFLFFLAYFSFIYSWLKKVQIIFVDTIFIFHEKSLFFF